MSTTNRSYGVWFVAILVAVLIGIGIFWLARNSNALRFELPSRRGATVERLRVVRKALESYRAQNGRLPLKLEDLGLGASELVDGAGRPFVYAVRAGDSNSVPTRRERLIVTMSAPTGHLPLVPEKWDGKWAYAVVEDASSNLVIRSTTNYSEIAP